MQEVKLNSRVKFPENKQKQFLEEALLTLNTNISGFAEALHVCDRTVRDWRREKNNIDFASLFLICNKINTRFPQGIKVLPPYWSTKKAGKLGGKRRIELYGPPGTLESRRKGGLSTKKKILSDPNFLERIKKAGFITRKKIKQPEKSFKLAEFVGIMLGDGGIHTNHQAIISYNGKEDRDYALYLQKLVKNLFAILSTNRIQKEKGHADIVISSTELIEFLQKIGIKKGNKVKNQVDIPSWILQSKAYQKACLRGLFDTDGCVYKHRYKVAGKVYSYLKMSFRNYSIPLLKSIKKMLENLNFHPAIDVNHQTVYINRPIEVKKYFSKIGTSNPRYRKKFESFLKNT